MKSANDFFGSSNGTEHYYKHSFSNIVYTDGVRDLAERCGAYWLIDLIVSHQCHQHIRKQGFQAWELKRTTGTAFIAECTDGNYNSVINQQIEYSDFPYEEAKLWLVDGCLMMPCEY